MARYPYTKPGTQLDEFRENLIKTQEDVAADIGEVAGGIIAARKHAEEQTAAVKGAAEQGIAEVAAEVKDVSAGLESGLEAIKKDAAAYAYAEVIDAARLEWKEPVEAFADLATTYPQAAAGWAAMTKADGKVYRFNGQGWDFIQQIDAGPVNALATATYLQMAETEEQQRKLKVASKSTNRVFVNVQDDDGRVEIFTKLKPLLDEFGIKASFAINPGLVGNSGFLSWAQIKQLNDEGHEILNHTKGTGGIQISSKTMAELAADYEFEKAAFIANGLNNYDYLVYSGTMDHTDISIRNKVSEFYKCCFANTQAPKNRIPFDNYAIRRGSLIYKAIEDIDEYLAMGEGFLVLFGHAWEYTAAHLTYIRTVFTKLNESNVTFVTAKKMVDEYENVINLGNVGENGKTLISKTGDIDFTIKGESVHELLNTYFPVNGFASGIDSNPITKYRENCITYEKVGGSYATHGLPQSGTVKTVRFKNDLTDMFAYQEYTDMTTGVLYKRFWNNSKKNWATLFAPYNPLVITTVANRPSFMRRGYTLYDNTLGKSLIARFDMFGYTNTKVNPLTAYAVGDYVNRNLGNNLYECITAGTTADPTPTYPTKVDDIVQDGTAIFKCIGFRPSFTDPNGAIVFW